MDKAALIRQAVDNVKAALLALRVLKGWSGVLGAFAAISHVVEEVEKAAKSLGLVGPDKKEAAIQIILEIVPDRYCPDAILRVILSFLIDSAVAKINARKAA